MTRSETTVGVTRIKVAGGDTQSFETTTYKTNSVKETGVSMQIAQQPSSNLCSTQGSDVKIDHCPAEQNGRSNSSLLHLLSRWYLAIIVALAGLPSMSFVGHMMTRSETTVGGDLYVTALSNSSKRIRVLNNMPNATTRLQRIAEKDQLNNAWRSLRRNKLSYGIDNTTIQAFKADLDANLDNIRDKLLSKGGYKFSKIRGVAIPKGFTGKKRPIRVATVADRVVQKAIEIEIHEVLEKAFNVHNDASYAYIKDRGLLKAISEINRLISEGYTVCYKGDIKNYFGEVKRDILLDQMVFPALSKDTTLNDLISASLAQEIGNIQALRKKHGSKEISELFPDLEYGIPQGGILSPLFSNIYLKDFDRVLLDKGFKLIRYADDFVVLTKSLEDALEADKIAREEVAKLQLELYPLQARTILKAKKHKSKSYVCNTDDFEFLGIHFKASRLYPSAGAFKKTSTKIRTILKNKKYMNKSLGYKLETLERICNSWANTYWFTSADKVVKSSYFNINLVYTRAIEELVDSFGLSFKHPDRTFQKKLKALGLSKFETKLQSVKDNINTNEDKKHLKELFTKPEANK